MIGLRYFGCITRGFIFCQDLGKRDPFLNLSSHFLLDLPSCLFTSDLSPHICMSIPSPSKPRGKFFVSLCNKNQQNAQILL